MRKGINIIVVLLPFWVHAQVDLTPPKDTAMVFLPDIVSTKNHEHSSPAISPTNESMCWSIWERPAPENPRQMIQMLDLTRKNTAGTPDFSAHYSDGGPIWIDVDKLLFYSKRPIRNQKSDEIINDLWIIEKQGRKWAGPTCLYFSAHTKYAVSPSTTNSGTIYFAGFLEDTERNIGIYRAQLGTQSLEEFVRLNP